MGNGKSSGAHGDGRLWAAALAFSLMGNLAILSFVTLAATRLRKEETATARPAAVSPEASVLISPDLFETVREAAAEEPPAAEAVPAKPGFARTSEDQRGKRPDRPAFIGERDTEAASDRAPDPSAPPLPSQAGIEPRHDGDVETTESDYRDGDLAEDGVADGSPSLPSPPVPPAAEVFPVPPVAEVAPPPPVVPEREALVDGPNPVEVPVPKETPGETPLQTPPSPPRETPVEETTEAEKPAEPEEEKPAPEPPKPASPPAGKPGFRGYQRKTAIRGNISRSGRSSLDVVDSPLGRYQAAISRAVEREWQINCARNRDFITPGYLTVRFFVESSGKVRSVQFVGEMETGQIQKGFTLNSIRDAAIPAMPKGVREEFADEPLELIFNFYF